ncbi:hypothetical protein [Celeribacter sp.]|uniref:hypothetical protein n=1 Tax=Celeribacter sp. TaxID=1890673 RepID=UPI003A8F14B7
MSKKEASKTQVYIANADGRVGGKRVKEGEEIALTPKAAKYENVRLKGTDSTPTPKKTAAAKGASDA